MRCPAKHGTATTRPPTLPSATRVPGPILPGMEATLTYRLMFLMGNGIYPIFDMMLAQARRKKDKVKT